LTTHGKRVLKKTCVTILHEFTASEEEEYLFIESLTECNKTH